MDAHALTALVVAPHPPPVGGMAAWTSLLTAELRNHADVHSEHVDTAVRWRGVTQTGRLRRLMGGSLQSLRDVRAVGRQIGATRPDVAHICTSAGFGSVRDLLMVRSCARRSVPCVIHYHMGRLSDLGMQGGLEWRLIRAAAQRAATVIALDERSAAALSHHVPGADVRALPNMLDLNDIDSALSGLVLRGRGAAEKPVLAFVGHVVPAKGVEDLIRAVGERALALDLVGPVEPRYRASLEALARGVRRLDVRFHGTLSHEDALRVMATADIVALPSHTEGFPYVVMEAMACGRPVLATSVGAIPEMLWAGEPDACGVCVPPRDPDRLGEALTGMLDDSLGRARMGANGRARVEAEYAAAIVCARLVALWREVASRGCVQRATPPS